MHATTRNENKLPKSITVEELSQAGIAIINYVQLSCLPWAIIQRGEENVPRDMRALCPVVGEDGLMRVGGRINQPHVEGCSTHQILLPKQHHICDLIVREHHERSGHSGCEHTLAQLRMTYWIIGARRIIKKLIRNCIVCRKRAAIPCQQKMAALPDVRVLPREPPFSNSGVDVFGPYEVKYNRSSVKRYGCLFTCMASRAIHIELLYTLDTSSFIDALRRFIARR